MTMPARPQLVGWAKAREPRVDLSASCGRAVPIFAIWTGLEDGHALLCPPYGARRILC
jgi:hypothetical protein